MGLLDGCYDPDQFEASGGLLGRLLSLQRQQGMLPYPDFGLPASGAQPSTPPPMGWIAAGSASRAQILQPQDEALRATSAGGNAASGTPTPQPWRMVQPLANEERSEPNLAPAQTSAVPSALADFYRQTILQAGRDIVGYASDAMHDPEVFTRGMAPSVAALGPVAGELPATIRALLGALRIAGSGPPALKLGDLTPEEIEQIQSVVNEAGRPLEVIGSAARGVRSPKSDIDYLVPHTSLPYYTPTQ